MIFRAIDALPIVRLLQVVAVVILVVSLVQFGLYFGGNAPGIPGAGPATRMALISFVRALYEPAILLAAAQVLKILSEKK